MGHDRHPSAGCKPRVVGLELQTEPVVVDPQVAVGAADDGVRPHVLHVLRHDADIRSRLAVIDKAIDAETVVEMAEQNDVVLEPDVGAASAAATRPAAATTATAAGAAASAAHVGGATTTAAGATAT